ncbi:MAG: enolase C-terminal domain-like protein [Burkholderiaceae bacterium]
MRGASRRSKMQVAHLFTADEDVANVRDMRAALGDDIEIMVDVNQGWTVAEAIKVGRRLDDYRLHWLEEPVIADDFDGYHAVADAIRTPVVGGENHFTHHDFKPFFRRRQIPILQRTSCAAAMPVAVIAEQASRRAANRATHVPGTERAPERVHPEPVVDGIHELVTTCG